MITCVIGVDPGPTSGVCLLCLEPVYDIPGVTSPPVIKTRLVFSCNAPAVFGLVEYLLEANDGPARIVAVGERFVPGRGAGARSGGAAVVREVIADLKSLHGSWKWRSASDVKPWATDRRLDAAGLLGVTNKMIDARDAARHALFCAVHDCGLPDPMSRKAVRVPANRVKIDGRNLNSGGLVIIPANLDGMDN